MPGSNLFRIRQTGLLDGCNSVEFADRALSECGMICAASVFAPESLGLLFDFAKSFTMYIASYLPVTTQRFPSRARQWLRRPLRPVDVPWSGPTSVRVVGVIKLDTIGVHQP